jgi:hypothetical protein
MTMVENSPYNALRHLSVLQNTRSVFHLLLVHFEGELIVRGYPFWVLAPSLRLFEELLTVFEITSKGQAAVTSSTPLKGL